ncbi:MAG: FtsX-like permease family protein [Oscillospiraceae bacterium]|nr:FtsX-like permease family protein [Oscillospiraceae bacterium]
MTLKEISFKYLTGQKKHTIMTIIAITISVAFMTVLLSAVSVYSASSLNVAREENGTYHVLFSGLDKQSLVAIQSMDIFEETEYYSVSAYTDSVDIDFGQNEDDSARMEYLMLAGDVVNDSFLRIKGEISLLPAEMTALTAGRMPEKDGEIVISAASSPLWGYPEIGDVVMAGLITCVPKGSGQEAPEFIADSLRENFDVAEIAEISFTVVGFSERYNMVDYSDTRLRSYSYLTDNLLARFSEKTNDLYWDMDEAFSAVGLEIDDFDYSLNQQLLDAEGKGVDAKFSRALFFAVMYLFVIFIMFCVRLVIDNSFEISSKERIKQFGLLKAAGASKKQVLALVLWEALYLAIPGVILGLLLGSVCAYGVYGAVAGLPALNAGGLRLSDTLVYEVRPYVYITSAVIGIVWVCVSAVATGLRSINATPVQAIRMTGKNEKITVPRRPSKMGQGGSFIGAYSSLSIKRNKKRYIITMLSMVMSIVLFTGFSYGARLAEESIENDFDVIRAPSDYTVGHISLSPVEAIHRAQEMTATGLFDYAQADTYISLYADVESFGLGADSELYERGSLIMNLRPVNRETFEKYISTDVTYDDIDEGGAIIICSDMYKDGSSFDYRIYDSAPGPVTAQPFIADTLDFLDPVKATPVGLYTTDNRTYRSSNNIITAVIGEENYLALLEVCGRDNKTHTINLDNGESYYAFNRDILANAAPGQEENALIWLDRHFYGSYSDNSSERAEAMAVLSAVRLLGYFVIGIIALIAAVNIVNIISANVLGRTSELAMLRACGMSDKQLRGLILRESALYAAAAALISLIMVEGAIGIIHIPFLTHFHDLYLEDLGFKLSFITPLKYLIIAAAAAFITAAAASLAPAGRIVKTSIVESIRQEG